MRLKRLAASALFGFLGVYLAICAVMFFAQRALLYRPDKARVPAAQSGIAAMTDIEIKTSDGETLAAWQLAAADAAKPVYLYLHGNGSNIANRAARFKIMTADGSGLLALSWRGYGGSTGQPSEAGLHADALAAYQHLAGQVDPRRIIIFGESLGSGPALKLASGQTAGAVILDSPYVSMQSLAASLYWWLPVRLLLRDTYRSDLWVGGIKAPLLILHGARDPVVPVAWGEQLFTLASQPKRFFHMPDAGHVQAYTHGAGPAVEAFLKDFWKN